MCRSLRTREGKRNYATMLHTYPQKRIFASSTSQKSRCNWEKDDDVLISLLFLYAGPDWSIISRALNETRSIDELRTRFETSLRLRLICQAQTLFITQATLPEWLRLRESLETYKYRVIVRRLNDIRRNKSQLSEFWSSLPSLETKLPSTIQALITTDHPFDSNQDTNPKVDRDTNQTRELTREELRQLTCSPSLTSAINDWNRRLVSPATTRCTPHGKTSPTLEDLIDQIMPSLFAPISPPAFDEDAIEDQFEQLVQQMRLTPTNRLTLEDSQSNVNFQCDETLNSPVEQTDGVDSSKKRVASSRARTCRTRPLAKRILHKPTLHWERVHVKAPRDPSNCTHLLKRPPRECDLFCYEELPSSPSWSSKKPRSTPLQPYSTERSKLLRQFNRSNSSIGGSLRAKFDGPLHTKFYMLPNGFAMPKKAPPVTFKFNL